ncbi:MAG: MaoC family dehydratase [Chloroflexi bacterium]|nr:MaoC family dehydratase [Chloroflexota bacterium]
MRYFEDFEPGQVFDLGSVALSAEEIVAFARQYDPQSFHTDPEAAEDSPYGGLIASGWHTAVLYMRLLVDGLFRDTAGMGSPGLDELRWLKPVRPGDTLTGRCTVLDRTPSRSKPDRGIVRFRAEMANQAGEVVLRFTGIAIVGRRTV